MAEYTETEAVPGDTRCDVVSAVVGGLPWVLIAVEPGEENGGFNVEMLVGGGIDNVGTIRRLLEKTIVTLPES